MRREGETMWTLELPELGGTRDVAARLVGSRESVEHLDEGASVALLARDLLSSSASFSDELVKALLEERKVRKIVLVGAPKRFRDQIEHAARQRGFESQVSVDTALKAGL